jgi:Kelch motif
MIFNRLFANLKRLSGPSFNPKARLIVESLEERAMPTGTWTTLANPFPSDGAANMLLLSDGTVMVQGGAGFASNAWFRLSPDATGSYVNGTWSKLPGMSLARRAFTSDVLPDGRVFIMGGEYSGPNSDLNTTNTGEIYDPVANTWTKITNFPVSHFGDDPSEVLPNGDVLAGYFYGAETYIYHPATNTWSATGSKLRADWSDEETWVKLPDDSILSYDIFSSIWTGTGHAQRYIPSQGEWVDAGTVPFLLGNPDNGNELGPALLLPVGRAFFLGANGDTAFYTPPVNSTDVGTWTAGPSIPNGLFTADAPGAMLPSGDVLFAASSLNFPAGPTTIFEFNPTTNTYADVTPHNGFNLNVHSSLTSMLVLPTGQIMLTNDTRQIDVFTPDGAPNPSWQPTISNITDNGNNIFTLTGTQLNGLSEGASYGDDAEMASNYPIVRLIDANGNVSYARTLNWSSTGVATGSTLESVQFTLPPAEAPGAYVVSVIANGIASASVLDIQMGSANTNLTLLVDPNNAANVEVMNGGLLLGQFPVSSLSYLIVTGSNFDNTVVIENTFSGVPVTLNEGTGQDHITVGDGNLDAIEGAITINADASKPVASAALVVDDQDFTGSRTLTLTDSTIGWGGPTIMYAGLGSVTIHGGTVANTFNVLAISANTTVSILGGGGTNTLVGSNAGNTFVLAGNDAGTLGGSAYGSTVSFSQVGNLTGGSGGDTFQFADGATLTGAIAGGGRDTLDYSDYDSSVIVDLQTGFATGVGGTVSGISTIIGGSDKMPAASGIYNLLIGKGGNTLIGGFRRPNILVAGVSASTLTGDFLRDDLLIAGTTAYDTEAELSTWRQIAAYWAGSGTYAARVAALTSGSGVPLLDASVVIGNGGGNILVGEGELALLYTDGLDTITGFDPRSRQITIVP